MIEEYIVVAPKPLSLGIFPPFPTIGSRSARVRNQTDYMAFLAEFPYNEGDFLTFTHTNVEHLSQIHYIARIESNFNNVFWDAPTVPKIMHMVQCATPRGGVSLTPWVRWDNRTGYRLLTADEYNAHIKDQHDNIRHSCLKEAGYTP